MPLRFLRADMERPDAPRLYTQAGLDRIAPNDMSSVLLRHFPELAPVLRRVDNAFAPWDRVDRPPLRQVPPASVPVVAG